MSLRILLADDRSYRRARLAALAAGAGHLVVAAARDGRETVAMASSLTPDLVILSAGLPEWSLIVRAILARRRTAVVLLADYVPADVAQRARRSGVMACAPMPAAARQFTSLVDAALARFSAFDSVCRREVAGLDDALDAWATVERATGVLIRRMKLHEPEAFRRLKRQSETEETTLVDAAAAILATDALLVGTVDVAQIVRLVVDTVRRELRMRASLPWSPARRARAGNSERRARPDTC